MPAAATPMCSLWTKANGVWWQHKARRSHRGRNNQRARRNLVVSSQHRGEGADLWNFPPPQLPEKCIAVQSRPRSFRNERRESLLEPLSSAHRRGLSPQGCRPARLPSCPRAKPPMNLWVTCLSLRQVALPPNEAVGPSFLLSFLETIRAHGPTSSFYWIFTPRAGHSTVWKPRC